MEKTELKEKSSPKEVVTFSYLQNRKVKVVPAKRPNSWKFKFKIENNGNEINDQSFQFPTAKSWITVPLDRKTGQIKRVLDNSIKRKTIQYPNEELTEQEFFEKALGLPNGELEPNKMIVRPDGRKESDSFWKKIDGTVVLKNEVCELDLSKAEDMIKYKVIESNFKTLVAPSKEDVRKKLSYKYMVIDVEKALQEENKRLSLEMEAIDEFNRIKDDIQKLNEIIWMKEARVTESTNIPYSRAQCYKFAKEMPEQFLSIIKSPYREVKIVLLQAVKKGVIVKTKEQTYRLRDGYDIGTMDKALQWMKNPENFDRVELIKDQIKMAV